MFNPANLIKLKQARELFIKNHPKFPKFLKRVKEEALKEGTILEIKVIKDTGETMTANIKLKESDVELLQEMSNLFQ